MRIGLKVDRRTSNKEEKLRRRYSIKAKGFEIKELTQKIAGKAGKLKHYKARVTEYRQNKLFSCIQKDYMKNLVVNADDATEFEVRYGIKLFSLRKMLNGWLRSKRKWRW